MHAIVPIGAFGDALMAGLFTAILRDNGVDAYFACNWPDIREVLDCAFLDDREGAERWNWGYGNYGSDRSKSFVHHSLVAFAQQYGYQPFEVTRHYVPVHFRRDPSTPVHDVAICSRGGPWSPYRHWHGFDALKQRLQSLGITYVDLHEQKLRGQACLNYVNASRVYLGLDTGMSHMVSQVVRRGLIIQSGYNHIEQWSTYGYQAVSLKVECSPCFLREGCKYDHKCMQPISTELVLKRLLPLLDS